MRLCGQLIDVATISAADRARMQGLMDRHYCNVSPAVFDADLAEKQWVIQVTRPDTGELCGFSTQMVLEATVQGRSIKALFSGDTIVDRQYWGDTALMQVGGRLALSLIEDSPQAEWYWFLISQGYKTYRFLPVFFREFYPRYDQPTPEHVGQLLDTLGSGKFAERYDKTHRIVRSRHDQYHLREDVARITAERLQDPHIRFFVEQNPRHAAGDELCCLARLTRDNFTEAAYRVLGRTP